MDIQQQFERDSSDLTDALLRGEISRADFDKAMRDLRLDLQQAAQEAAQAAYAQVMGG